MALHQTDHKLFTPITAHDIGRTDNSPGQLHYMEQHVIAKYVPMTVMDLFEVVHIEKQECELVLVTTAPVKLQGQRLHQCAPVVHRREEVTPG